MELFLYYSAMDRSVLLGTGKWFCVNIACVKKYQCCAHKIDDRIDERINKKTGKNCHDYLDIIVNVSSVEDWEPVVECTAKSKPC